jgi:ABC-type transporter Mla subunit MlaD
MNNSSNDIEEIKQLLAELARKQNTTQDQILTTQEHLDELASDVNRVLGRSAVLDDVVLELRDNTEVLQRNQQILITIAEQQQTSFERHRQEFIEHQRTTNAALASLEAILLQLTRRE